AEVLDAAGVLRRLAWDGKPLGLRLPVQPQRRPRGQGQKGAIVLVAPGDRGPALDVAHDLAGLAAVDDVRGGIAAAQVLPCRPALLDGLQDQGRIAGDLFLTGDVAPVLGPVVALQEDIEVVPAAVVKDLDGGMARPADVAALPAGRLEQR